MGITPVLTPSLVRQCILDEEQPYRRQFFPAEVVDAVCRYGLPIGSHLQIFEQQGRCMDRAREIIKEFEEADRSFPSGMGLIARELTHGKGRFQRIWHAPQGGLWLTLVLVDTLLSESSKLYPLAAGVACCELMRQYGIDSHIKWVNDVHVNGGKIAGILIETLMGPLSRERYVLMGIGINVNNDVFPPELSSRATSMKEQLDGVQELDLVAARLFAKLSWNLGLLQYEEARYLASLDDSQPAGVSPLLVDSWKSLSDSLGRNVWFGFDVEKAPQYKATVIDIQDDGGIVLQLEENQRFVTEYSGEIRYTD